MVVVVKMMKPRCNQLVTYVFRHLMNNVKDTLIAELVLNLCGVCIYERQPRIFRCERCPDEDPFLRSK